ncbi:MAG: hypothetical protein RL329_3080 [Bacteroidota bacterium]|jgi:hypothetical protein
MIQQELSNNGFTIIPSIFTEMEMDTILQTIENHKVTNLNFKTNHDVFAIRYFLKTFPNLQPLLMNDSFKKLVATLGTNYKIVKAIYFDKPVKANWVVNWHQDLTISVQEKSAVEGFTHWLPKENYFSVQPAIQYLENIVTIRIHLDHCTQNNGALRIIPKSHYHIAAIKNLSPAFLEEAQVCEVPKGGVLVMKPLIWHSSKRTENQQKRRVLHLELSNMDLPKPLIWAEL